MWNEEIKIKAQQDIVAELSVNAPTLEIRDCLRLYKPGNSTTQLQKDLSKCSKPIVLATLDYLKVNEFENYTKPACVTKLVCQIQSLFPDECQVCGDRYCVKLGDTPLLTCEICGQGSHDTCVLQQLKIPQDDWKEVQADQIKAMCNPHNMPGIHYLCGACKLATIPAKDTGMMKKKPNAPQEAPAEEPNTQEETPAPSEAEHSAETEDVENEQTPVDRTSGDKDSSQMNSDRICSYYRKGTCRHGSSGKECSFNHPRPCRKLLKHGTKGPHGCTLGRDKCPSFHPKMCPTSITKGECYNGDCKLRHVSGTKRKQDSTTANETAKSKTQIHDQTQKSKEKGSGQDSFLDALRLLKEEMLEAMDKKLASLTRTTENQRTGYNQTGKETGPPAPWTYPQPYWNPSMMYQMTPGGMMARTPMTTHMGTSPLSL